MSEFIAGVGLGILIWEIANRRAWIAIVEHADKAIRLLEQQVGGQGPQAEDRTMTAYIDGGL